VDEPDWVSWRWLAGLGGALLIVGAWLFGFGDPVWLSVPMLLALATPRLRDGSPVPFSLGVVFVQNLPVLAVLVLVVRDVSTDGELSELTVVLAVGITLVAALGHGLWVAGQRGPVAGLGVGLAGCCAALVISGWLAPLTEAYYVMGALLLLGGDIVSSLTPDMREDRMILPTVATALFLLAFGGMHLFDGELLPQASAVVATALVGLPVAWSIKRTARHAERRYWSVST
jgi:hypothetical protein